MPKNTTRCSTWNRRFCFQYPSRTLCQILIRKVVVCIRWDEQMVRWCSLANLRLNVPYIRCIFRTTDTVGGCWFPTWQLDIPALVRSNCSPQVREILINSWLVYRFHRHWFTVQWCLFHTYWRPYERSIEVLWGKGTVLVVNIPCRWNCGRLQVVLRRTRTSPLFSSL